MHDYKNEKRIELNLANFVLKKAKLHNMKHLQI
jgi:hypothetical protein